MQRNFLHYSGAVDHEKIDELLQIAKKSLEFNRLDRLTAKRVYAILVECLENIAMHSRKDFICGSDFQPYISAWDSDEKIRIRSGNYVTESERKKLTSRLELINSADKTALDALWEAELNKEMTKNNGAGLGFMLIKLRSGNNINFNFNTISGHLLYFELEIFVNKHYEKADY